MSSYPYLMAQLPELRFSDREFPACQEFIEQAECWLSEDELTILKSADLNDCTATEHTFEFLREWSEFMFNMRHDLANYRESHRLGHDHKTHMFPTSWVKDENPLVAELKIMEFQWEFLAERKHVHHDDLHAIVIYCLQLQILERVASFSKELGRSRFDELADIKPLDINLEGYRWQTS